MTSPMTVSDLCACYSSKGSPSIAMAFTPNATFGTSIMSSYLDRISRKLLSLPGTWLIVKSYSCRRSVQRANFPLGSFADLIHSSGLWSVSI